MSAVLIPLIALLSVNCGPEDPGVWTEERTEQHLAFCDKLAQWRRDDHPVFDLCGGEDDGCSWVVCFESEYADCGEEGTTVWLVHGTTFVGLLGDHCDEYGDWSNFVEDDCGHGMGGVSYVPTCRDRIDSSEDTAP